MPGINIIVKKLGNFGKFSNENDQLLYQNQQLSISKSVPYRHYPIQLWENDRFVFVIEGFFYEWIDWKTKIEEFAGRYENAVNRDLLLAEYFADTDAEFVVVVHNKHQNSTIIFNDALGRLQLYIDDKKQSTVVSRNISFIHLVHGLAPEVDAFHERLTFGFTLGTKTLYKEIERLPGGTIIDISGNYITKRQYYFFNYQQLINQTLDPEETIANVRSLLIEALRNRSKYADLNVLALSGGLDSRTVAGAFRMSGLPYSLCTYSDKEGSMQRDVRWAKKVAEKQNLPWKLVHLEDPQVTDFELMFNHKYGLAGLDMTLLVDFYRYLVSLSTRPALYTGDGGDKVFPDLRPGTLFQSEGSIINYAIRSNSKMDPAIAGGILGKDLNHLHKKVGNLIRSYPEPDWDQKYVHFIMDNRVSNWLVEGEDRNRCFLTSFTPFYHIRVFKSLMSVPPHFKKNFHFYGRFLKAISPETCDIPYANWGFDISKKKRIQWTYFKQDLKNTSVGTKINKWRQKDDNYLTKATAAEKELFARFSSTPLVQSTFDIDFIRSLKSFSADNYLSVLTLMKIASL